MIRRPHQGQQEGMRLKKTFHCGVEYDYKMRTQSWISFEA